MPGKGSRIDAGDRGNPRLAQHRGQLLGIVENGRGGVGHDQAAQPRPLRLVVVVDAAVIADQRVGHHDQLARVAGIRGDLLVAGLAGVDDEVALA